MEEIRVGLAGLGHRGLHWLRLLQRLEGFRVRAICDPIAALHKPALALLDGDREVARFTRYGDMLATAPIEAVALCVRCREQGALAAAALEAGKHVCAEVPAAHTLEDCWRIVTATERTGLVFLLAEQTRYWGFVDAWRDLVREGALGTVTYCEGQYVGYYGMSGYFQDPATGRFCHPDERARYPQAQPTWRQHMPPIHYLPHELSPILKVLDDRVVEVAAMSTESPSHTHPAILRPDVQVALMKTERGVLLRLLTSFTQPVPHGRPHHWYQVMGTGGFVEWARCGAERPKMWLANRQMHDVAEVDWRYQRTDAPPEARATGHGDADYFVHAAFRDAVLHGRAPELDVYGAMDTAAPAILAATSIDQGTRLLPVPDFRPGPTRPAGRLPEAS